MELISYLLFVIFMVYGVYYGAFKEDYIKGTYFIALAILARVDIASYVH